MTSRPFGVIALALLAAGCGGTTSKRAPVPVAAAPPAVTTSGDRMRDAWAQAVLAPSEAHWLWRLAALQIEADSIAAAEVALDSALARDPDHVPSLALRSKLDFRAGRHAETVLRIEATRARRSTVPAELLAALALHLDALGEAERSRAAVAAIAPADRARVAGALAYLELRAADPAAERDATIALERNGASAANRNNHGIARLRAGDAEGARAAFLAAIESDPNLPGPYYNLAILEKYYRLDDREGARWLALYRQRATADPDRLIEAFGATDHEEEAPR